jgi:hypothetical protein
MVSPWILPADFKIDSVNELCEYIKEHLFLDLQASGAWDASTLDLLPLRTLSVEIKHCIDAFECIKAQPIADITAQTLLVCFTNIQVLCAAKGWAVSIDPTALIDDVLGALVFVGQSFVQGELVFVCVYFFSSSFFTLLPTQNDNYHT